LRENGYTVDEAYDLNQKELLDKVSEYNGLIIRSKFKFDKELLDKATQLRFIARAGAGMEHIDIPYATSKGVACLNSPEGNAAAVAEHVIGMMLCLLHNIRRSDAEMRDNQWNREANRGNELSYKTVGVLGTGNTGSQLIKKLSGFGCRVIAHDLISTKVDEKLAESVSLERLQAESDIISIHIPMKSENAYFINREFIHKCKKPLILINASRGGILHTSQIIECLEEGRITSLGMDVFENEKTQTFTEEEKAQFAKLRSSDNVILTPHVAGWSIESEYKIAEVLVKKILKLS